VKRLHLTERALSDIDKIYTYSIERWSQSVADRYLDDLNEALRRLDQDLVLFEFRPKFSGRLHFYRAQKHVFIGDVIKDVGYVLAVWHGSMDFIERLSKLEPLLIQEVELMAKRVE
jgi:toxin ParE1/3/4